MKQGMMNKIFLITLCFLFIFNFVAVVSAEDSSTNITETTKQVLTGTGEWISSILEPFFGEKEMVTRIFFAILLFMIIQPITSSMFKQKSFSWITAGIITAIALLALPSNFLEAIRINFGAMGAAILSVIPFIILLIFTIKLQSKFMAQLLWLFFVGYYFLLALDKIFNAQAGWVSAETIPYWGIIILGILMMFFMTPIRKLIFKGELSSEEEQAMRDISYRGLGRKLERKETESRLRTD